MAKIILLYIIILSNTLFAQVDTTYFSYFVENLKKVEYPLPQYVIDSSNAKAKNIVDEFVEEFNKQTPSNNNKIDPTLYLKLSTNYELDNRHLFSLGYAFVEDSANIEIQSAHIFVFGEYSDDRIIFISEMNEIEGEIQFKLLGCGNSEDEIIIYGEAYPYFGFDYGKFILSVTTNNKKCVWQYHFRGN